MSQMLLFVLPCLLGLAVARTNINCSLEFDDSLSMQQQLQGQDVVVPFDINPPFVLQSDDGKFSGFSYDVLQEIAIRGNFSVSVIAGGQIGENETSDKTLVEMLATSDFVGSYWPDTPSRRANRVMISLHYVDVTRYLVTLPYLEKEETVLDNMFAFLRPFSPQLWVVILFGILFSGAVTYALELSPLCGPRNMMQQTLAKEPNGKRWTVYWGFIHRSFSHFTMTGDSIEAKSVMGQVHNVVWAFVVMVLLAAYTANLAGTLVVKKTQYIEYSSLQAIDEAQKALCIFSEDRQYVTGVANLVELSHNETRTSGIELAEALLAGECVGAILTESAYQILRTDVTFCNLTQRMQIGPTLGGGFAFPIDRCGTYYLAVVNSILTGMRADRSLDALWAKHVKQVNCPAKPVQVVVSKAQGMRLADFSGLFILYLCWVGGTVALRIFERTYSGLHIAAEKVKARVSKHNPSNTEENFDPSISTTNPRYSTTSNQSEIEEFANDLDSLDSKVAGVEFTMSHIMATLRDLNIDPAVAGQTHKRMLSKQTNLDVPKASTPQSTNKRLSKDFNLDLPKASPQSTNKRLSKDLVTTFISSEEKKSVESTGRLSQNKASPVSEPVKSSQILPSPTQTPEPISTQNPEPTLSAIAQTPEPTIVQTPEPAIAQPSQPEPAVAQTPAITQTPEPAIAQTPEPVVAQTPEPAVTQTPEPVVAQTPEPVVAQTPEPVVAQTPEPAVAQAPEPVVAQTPELVVAQTPEPAIAQTPEPAIAQTPEPVVAQTPEPAVAQTPEPVVAQTPEPTNENISVAPVPEKVVESTKRLSQNFPAEPTPASFAVAIPPVLDEKSDSKVETSMNLQPLDIPEQSEIPKRPELSSEPTSESAPEASSVSTSGATAEMDVQKPIVNEPVGGLDLRSTPVEKVGSQELDDSMNASVESSPSEEAL